MHHPSPVLSYIKLRGTTTMMTSIMIHMITSIMIQHKPYYDNAGQGIHVMCHNSFYYFTALGKLLSKCLTGS